MFFIGNLMLIVLKNKINSSNQIVNLNLLFWVKTICDHIHIFSRTV